jgi:hypothetical protein
LSQNTKERKLAVKNKLQFLWMFSSKRLEPEFSVMLSKFGAAFLFEYTLVILFWHKLSLFTFYGDLSRDMLISKAVEQ